MIWDYCSLPIVLVPRLDTARPDCRQTVILNLCGESLEVCSVTEQRDHVRIYARRGRGAFDRQVGLALLLRSRETKAQAIFRFLLVSLTFPVLFLHLARTCRHCLLPTGSASGLTKPRPIMSAMLGPAWSALFPRDSHPTINKISGVKVVITCCMHVLACDYRRFTARRPSESSPVRSKLGTRRLRAKIVCSTVHQFAAKKIMWVYCFCFVVVSPGSYPTILVCQMLWT